MMQRTRIKTTATEYNQHAASIISIAATIGRAIVGLPRSLIVAP
jgi:hypothetical protein